MVTYLLIGIAFILAGMVHLIPAIGSKEHRLVGLFQRVLGQTPWIGLFQEVWFLGRTAFFVIVVLLMTAFQWKLGLVSVAVFLITVGIEQLVKIAFDRARPFQTHPELVMLQPRKPTDASFPSGDSLRIWFLALILPAALGSSPFGLPAAILIASLVSAGRLVMGVHYLTDVLAGVGLGFLCAGSTILIWQTIGLI